MARRGGSGARGRRALRLPLAFLSIVVISAPLSIVGTMLLRPAWSWLESAAGIEAIGPSGPAEWCYLLVFAVLVVSGAGTVYLLRSRADLLRDP